MDDQKIWDEQLGQLDPELRARVEAWREQAWREQARAVPDEDGDEDPEIAALMQEPPGGHATGRAAWGGSPPGSDPEEARFGDSTPSELARVDLGNNDEDNAKGRWRGGRTAGRELGTGAWQAVDFFVSSRYERDGEAVGGAGVTDPSRGTSDRGSYGARDMGMTAHRGIVQPGMHVDTDTLRREVERRLGFTREEFQRTLTGGRPRRDDAALSRRINARLAELRAQGANFAVLAPVLGCSPQALGERAARGARS
jgi:hypothetical protein